MKVYGIDPAPTKKMAVFHGAYERVALEKSSAYLADLADGDDCLICWDAPLTGPPSAVVNEAARAAGSAFSQRPIESFFDRATTGYKTPAGISVQGYSGCSHWAVTRALLGLPRVGRYDAKATDLPFSPLTSDEQRPTQGRCVVEVHPAVAMWLWCHDGSSPEAMWLWRRDGPDPETPWFYKGSKVKAVERRAALARFWAALLKVQAVAGVFSPEVRAAVPESDDELDARVAYALGVLWLDGSDEVVFLGDADSGGFLLPRDSKMEEAFRDFVEGLAAERTP